MKFRVRAGSLHLAWVLGALLAATSGVQAADKELLDILLGNGAITPEQHERLMKRDELSAADFGARSTSAEVEQLVEEKVEVAVAERVGERFDEAVTTAIDERFPVDVSYGSGGFRLATRDGNWETNLGWRAQLRFTTPTNGDPRQQSAFDDNTENSFEARRLRMKIGGHGFRPWLGYYFEVDLQPSRDVDDSSTSSSARVIDWRITLDKWDALGMRVGQWKVDYNRERGDSSGRQQFVERSIVNRVFTIDRQVGMQLRGHLFKDSAADLRYWAGVFTGEGRGVVNDSNDMMYTGRLQWNFLGRDLPWRQTDVELTEQPTGSLAFGYATHKGRCTRWSSSGCGNLDGFASPATAEDGQFRVEQMVQELAFKYRGFSFQEEFHWKTIDDDVMNTESDLYGGYVQAGYMLNGMFPSLTRPLELAVRYAFVEEPNSVDRDLDNFREEYSIATNLFFAGHKNKLTFDFSYLTLDDDFTGRDLNDTRARFQWDVSF